MKQRSSLSLCGWAVLAASAQCATAAEVAPSLRADAARDGRVDSLIALTAQAPRQLLRKDGNYLERRRALVAALRATADSSQADLRAWLDANGVTYRSFWINNLIEAELTPAQLDAIAARADVARIAGNRAIALRLPRQTSREAQLRTRPNAIAATTWGLGAIHAPQVWAEGITGQGVVIAGQDTGIRWTHNALKPHYRGWDGTTADHNYNWHDAIHVANNRCVASSTVPCDDNGHGSHTVGTVLGDDGAGGQYGVAPSAKWIGCRNMNLGAGTPSSYNECAQWLLAPTDSAGQNADPDRAPDIVTNSWGCDGNEGCTGGGEVKAAIDALVEGGILFVAAAGNGGASCDGIDSPPAIYDSAFTVGSMGQSFAMSGFSLRGPVSGAGRVKPDVIAPGEDTLSASRGSDTATATLAGTSMATPHVAGTAALLMATNPALKGDPQRVMDILRETAVPISDTQVCGGVPATTIPNPVQGYGRIDAYAAFRVAESIFRHDFEEAAP